MAAAPSWIELLLPRFKMAIATTLRPSVLKAKAALAAGREDLYQQHHRAAPASRSARN